MGAEAQRDRGAGRDGLDLGEQALVFGEFAEVRALQRAIQREFGGVDAGGRLFIERAARQRFEKFGGLGIIAAMVARSEEHTSDLQSLMRSSYAVFCLNKISNDGSNNLHSTSKPRSSNKNNKTK